MNNKNKFTIIMIAIIAMLSIYYYTLDDKANLVNTNDDNTDQVDNTERNEQFMVMRLELTNSRENMIEDLQVVLVNSDATTEQKNDVIDAIKEINLTTEKELGLEKLILDQGYSDVFVHCDGESVNISVISTEHTVTEANSLIVLAKNHFGYKYQVAVTFVTEDSTT